MILGRGLTPQQGRRSPAVHGKSILSRPTTSWRQAGSRQASSRTAQAEPAKVEIRLIKRSQASMMQSPKPFFDPNYLAFDTTCGTIDVLVAKKKSARKHNPTSWSE